ncbi:hypothetical protein KSU1_A0007 [Candidatus Jettenia caeni]|uniref:Uncharacterized protein n=1 Tax=Candidatus Jettenia caeni TaxID=247490 RepID=I3IGC9_9BACT|nr:hypothetical protein KSU1_A0007 [Candidatus Jettenia caeni]
MTNTPEPLMVNYLDAYKFLPCSIRIRYQKIYHRRRKKNLIAAKRLKYDILMRKNRNKL